MSIRTNVLIYIAVSIFLLVAAFTISVVRILDDSYEKLEFGILDRSVKRLAYAISQQEKDLARTLGDWAPWDDLYAFAQGRNHSFPDINLGEETIGNLNLQLILVFNADNELIFGTGFDAEDNSKVELPDGTSELFATSEFALASFTGIDQLIMNYKQLDGVPYLLSAQPILTSDFQGPPAGVILFGRKFDQGMAAILSSLVQFDVAVESHQHADNLVVRKDGADESLSAEKILLDAEYAYIHYPVVNTSGIQVANLCVTVPREVAAESVRTFRLLYATLLVTGLVMGFGILVILERSVLKPLDRIVGGIIAVGKSGKVDQRISGGATKGELSHLGDAINRMLDAIEAGNVERQDALRKLAEEKESLAITLRSISDGVITTNVEGHIMMINRVAESLTGWTQEEALGKPLSEVFNIINEETGCPVENPVERVMTTGEVVVLANHIILISRTGQEFAIADSGAPVRDRESRIIGVVLVFRDVTEQCRIEEDRIRSNKLESVGVLAGGIAHDFNNILTAIMANLSLANMPDTPREEINKYLDDAESSLAQARSLTKQLLTFSTGGAPVRRVIDLRELLVQAATFATRGSNIRCRFNIAEDLLAANVDPDQINQVINNLVFNAMEAMPDGGEIVVSARNNVDDPLLTAEERNRPHIRVEIEDKGTGIPAAYLSRIFDPYFSTKKRGSGLGLATCYSIVRKHDGHIYAESALNKGTRMVVLLPASLEKPTPKSREIPSIIRGSGRVLIMDDESAIREAASRILTAAGYEVSCAQDGGEAVVLYRTAMVDHPFDVVILDLTVPGGMGGMEAFQIIREINAEAKVIVSSGYSTAPIMAEYRKHGFQGILIKPYGIRELSQAVKLAVDS